ncbi:flippase [Methanococcus aeolicus]|uniref:flippase n=1 Tax=Methanococcus aeolicus TaxID=42879 RepID=UPI0021CA8D2F|nr:flippase [Methanococcus aeolicus]UXM85421.1 flippase [Methanococcus aeolicus]
MSTIKTIAKNTTILYMSEILSRFLGFVYVMYMARYLGAEGYGIISFAMAFTGIFAVFMDFGINQMSIRDISRDRTITEQYFNNILTLKIIICIVIYLLIIIIMNIADYNITTVFVVYVIALSTIFSSFNQTIYSIYQSHEKMEYMGIGKILNSILMFSGVFLAIFLNLDIIKFAYVYLMASIANFVYCIYVLSIKFVKPKLSVDWKFWKWLLKEALPFGLGVIFVSIYFNIDSVMLSAMKGNIYVGWYNAPYRLILVLLSIPALYTASILPIMSKNFKNLKNLKKIYFTSFKFLFSISSLIFIEMFLFADEIINFIYGADYEPSINALRTLIFVIPIIFITYLSGNLLSVTGKQKYLCNVVMLNAIFNILLNYLLIPRFDILGASIATVLTELIGLFLMMYCIFRYFFKLSTVDLMLKPLFCGGIVFLISYILKEYVNWIVLSIFGSLIYGMMLIAVDKQTKKIVFDLFNKFKTKF